MKKTLSILSLLALAALGAVVGTQEVNRLWKLSWRPNPEADAIAFYTVHVSGPVTNDVQVFSSLVELTEVFAGMPNGQYTVTVTATGKSALTSAPSLPVACFWYGNTPAAPAELVFSFPQNEP